MPVHRVDDAALKMEMEISELPRGSAVAGVARQLTTLLTSGQYAPGTRLPPERQLADALGVGRSAVREALAALEILGIVTVRPGSGTYFRDGMSELLPTTLSWGLMLSAPHTAELSEVRSGLEVQAAVLAAERISDEDLELLGSHLTRMEQSLDDLPGFVDADARFHLQIALAAENDVLRDLLQSVRSLLRLWVERGLSTREQAEVAVREHRAVHEALLARDPVAASTAMRHHMHTAGDRVTHALEGGD